MRILITGGCGFVGSVLSRLLKNETDHDTLVLDNGSRSMARPPDGVEHLIHDVRLLTEKNFDEWRPDAVVHLAARCSLPEGEVMREDYLTTNVFGTFSLSSAIRKSELPIHVIYAGSSAQPERPYGKAASWYGWTKETAEQSLRRTLPQDRITTLRLFNVAGSAFGVRESAGPYGRLIPNAASAIRAALPFKVRGNSATVRDFVHVLDVARAFIAAIEQRVPGTFEIGSGVGHTVVEAVRRVAALARRPVQFMEDGSFSHAEESRTVADIQGAQKALGWKPEKTLDDCILGVLEGVT